MVVLVYGLVAIRLKIEGKGIEEINWNLKNDLMISNSGPFCTRAELEACNVCTVGIQTREEQL